MHGTVGGTRTAIPPQDAMKRKHSADGPWKNKTTMSGKGEGGVNEVLKEGDTVNGNANTKASLEKH